MAYFLKKTKNKKGLYLQIYESFYDPERGHTAHKSYYKQRGLMIPYLILRKKLIS